MPSRQISNATPGTMALLLGPSLSEANREACLEYQTSLESTVENVLYVTFGKTSDQCLHEWQSRTGDVPERFGVITVGDFTRSVNAEAGSDFVHQISGVKRRVGTADPGDLTDIGTTISEYLELCGLHRPAEPQQQVVLCFHTLTALLQWNEPEETFKFLHILTDMLKSIEAIAHFHLDPEAVDNVTIATISAIMDEVHWAPPKDAQ